MVTGRGRKRDADGPALRATPQADFRRARQGCRVPRGADSRAAGGGL